jgi:hypothetical protein
VTLGAASSADNGFYFGPFLRLVLVKWELFAGFVKS